MANILIKQGKEIAGSNLVTPSTKADKVDLTSIIQTGTTSSQTISAGTYFYLNDTLVRAKVAIASGATFTLNTNYEVVTAGALNELKEIINAYSETERVVGKWIDGRLLYEKTIDCGALPNATTKRVAHSISNIKDIVDISGNFTNGTYWFPLNNPNPTSLNGQVQVYSSSTDIIINTATDLSNFNRSWVTLHYTKSS